MYIVGIYYTYIYFEILYYKLLVSTKRQQKTYSIRKGGLEDNISLITFLIIFSFAAFHLLNFYPILNLIKPAIKWIMLTEPKNWKWIQRTNFKFQDIASSSFIFHLEQLLKVAYKLTSKYLGIEKNTIHSDTLDYQIGVGYWISVALGLKHSLIFSNIKVPLVISSIFDKCSILL